MTDLLARIRAALGVSGEEPDRRARVAARLADPSNGPAPARARGSRAELMEAFRFRLQGHHGTAETIAELSNAPAAIAAWLAERALPERAVIAPALAHLDWSALAVEVRAPRSDDRIGISPAALGVAETGSLLLYAGANELLTLTDTDLGEWIVQLRREPPSHLVMPAIHLDRRLRGWKSKILRDYHG